MDPSRRQRRGLARRLLHVLGVQAAAVDLAQREAGAQPKQGGAQQSRRDNGNHGSSTLEPRAGGNFYKSGYAKASKGRGAPALGTRGAYKPGTLKEFKENDSGYKT